MMDRRRWLAGSLAGLGMAMPGCTLAARKIYGEPVLEVGTASHKFPEPLPRVAQAAMDVMKADLAEFDLDAKHTRYFVEDATPEQIARLRSKAGIGGLPPHYPGFWSGDDGRELWTFLACQFVARTRDGREVRVAALMGGEETILTAHYGPHGDREASRLLFEKVAQRLANPPVPVGTPEETAGLMTLIASKPDAQPIGAEPKATR